jgi:hypothetical protein
MSRSIDCATICTSVIDPVSTNLVDLLLRSMRCLDTWQKSWCIWIWCCGSGNHKQKAKFGLELGNGKDIPSWMGMLYDTCNPLTAKVLPHFTLASLYQINCFSSIQVVTFFSGLAPTWKQPWSWASRLQIIWI